VKALAILELEDVRIASPCRMRWEDMTGGDQVRFCAACQKNVFNLSGMKRAEAQQLVRATEGKICARFYRRSDGTVLTADCPVGVRLVARRAKRAVVGAMATSLGAVAAVLGFLASSTLGRAAPVEKARVTLTTVVQELEERHSELVVPEPRPEPPRAGGLAPPPPQQQPQQQQPKPKPKPRPKPVLELKMGDVAFVERAEPEERVEPCTRPSAAGADSECRGVAAGPRIHRGGVRGDVAGGTLAE
jgi:hypothetical protein